MKEYQMDFKALKSKVGIDDIAISLGYQIDRKAGLGRYIENLSFQTLQEVEKILSSSVI